MVVRHLVAVAVEQHSKGPRVVVSARRVHGHLVVVLKRVPDNHVVGGARADKHARHVARDNAVLHAIEGRATRDPDPRPAVLQLHLRDYNPRTRQQDAVVRALDNRWRAASVRADHDREAARAALLDLQRP